MSGKSVEALAHKRVHSDPVGRRFSAASATVAGHDRLEIEMDGAWMPLHDEREAALAVAAFERGAPTCTPRLARLY